MLPNTAAAKAGALANPGLAVAAIHSVVQIELATDALPLALFVLVLAFGSRSTALPATRGRRVFWSVCAAWPLLLVLSFALGGVQVVSRYLLPAIPCVLLLGMASLRWVIATTLPGRYTPLIAIGVWARDRTPPGVSFAIPDIGAFGYYSDRRVLDLYGLVTPEIAPVVVREGYDAVVKRLLFERAGRPEYLIDRHPVKARLAESGDETNPFRFLFAREIPNLGITRARTYYYSVYAIDWKVVDQTRIRIARRGPASWTNAGSLPGGG
ncbi:MAG: hypothetical protein E6K74_09750 [Candidatus Eisenbacteria bacterium]|uniref:Uncharacterized protein n=1 Tax=Eiseniibacteriota bacterium TaxID=2212470 RepID=A0A538SPJ8_UNCEI|nr:MAG: hypothetical protein E6K74_09750 [Candidatus Eisenbacteria bacterium]